jgi:benzoylformate decarboxylase
VSLLQIEASAERLAFNNRLDAGIVGDIAVSLRALTEALTAKASADFRQATRSRNASLAELQAKE